jgi:hypothetical protein
MALEWTMVRASAMQIEDQSKEQSKTSTNASMLAKKILGPSG